MSDKIWKDFQVPVVAGILVDKLDLTEHDAWAFAAQSSSGVRHSFWAALLWSMPLLGSCQLMIQNFAMGEPNASGIVVGDGQIVSAINPLLTEWLFQRRTVPTGTCIFAEATSVEFQRGTKISESHWRKIASVAGLPTTALALAFVAAISSVRHYSALFVFGLYLATTLSNFCIANQSQNTWAGFTGDTEDVQLLILAPGDRWAVMSGRRNLIKMITTGSHINQEPSILKKAGSFMLAYVLLSTYFLQGATWRDGMCIGGTLALAFAASNIRSRLLGVSPMMRRVRTTYVGKKKYRRRADLVEELSRKTNSDAWAYDCKLLTRRYISDKYRSETVE